MEFTDYEILHELARFDKEVSKTKKRERRMKEILGSWYPVSDKVKAKLCGVVALWGISCMLLISAYLAVS